MEFARIRKSPLTSALISAVLLILAFPPFHLSLLAFVALVPLLHALESCVSPEKRSKRRSFLVGWVFGFLFMSEQLFWIFSLVLKWTSNPLLSYLPYLLGTLAVSLFFGIMGVLIGGCYRLKLIWLTPFVWAGMEVVRSYAPVIGLPWANLSYALTPLPPLIQMGYFGSAVLVSAWVFVVNLLVARLLRGESLRQHRWLLAAIALFAGASASQYQRPLSGEKRTVIVGHPAINFAYESPGVASAKLRSFVEQAYTAARASNADLIVLPEGVADSLTNPPMLPFPVKASPPILFGAQHGNQTLYQSAFAYDGAWSYADKTKLVAFGEYVPGRDWLPLLDQFNLPNADLTPGKQVKALTVQTPHGPLVVGPLVCFEALFSNIASEQAGNGAQLLAVLSSDDWYGGATPEELQMATVWRAVETGLPAVRSATMGYTFAVDPKGEIVAQAPSGASACLRADLVISSSPRPFRYRGVFPLIALFSTLFVTVLLIFRPNKLTSKKA